MPPHAHEPATDEDWTHVSKKRPCSICGGHDRCRRGFDDQFACCVHTASDWPLTTGGWLHRGELPVREPQRRAPASVAGTQAAARSVQRGEVRIDVVRIGA